MLLRNLVGLVLSAALVLPLVGCGGDAAAPTPAPNVPMNMSGDDMDDAGAPDTDSGWDDDDTTTGN